MLTRAQAISAVTKVRMMHPDWSEQQVNEEVDLIREEYAMDMLSPNMLDGDYENPVEEGEGSSEVNA